MRAARGFSPVGEKLKLESCRELDLAFAVKGAVGARNGAERTVVSKRRRRTGAVVHRLVDAENMRTIDDVERFGEKFEIRFALKTPKDLRIETWKIRSRGRKSKRASHSLVGLSATKTSWPRSCSPRQRSTKCLSPPPKCLADEICKIRIEIRL